MVEWLWWDSSLISTTNWFPSVLWHCWFGHLACKNRPWNDLLCVEWDVKPYKLTLSRATVVDVVRLLVARVLSPCTFGPSALISPAVAAPRMFISRAVVDGVWGQSPPVGPGRSPGRNSEAETVRRHRLQILALQNDQTFTILVRLATRFLTSLFHGGAKRHFTGAHVPQAQAHVRCRHWSPEFWLVDFCVTVLITGPY